MADLVTFVDLTGFGNLLGLTNPIKKTKTRTGLKTLARMQAVSLLRKTAGFAKRLRRPAEAGSGCAKPSFFKKLVAGSRISF